MLKVNQVFYAYRKNNYVLKGLSFSLNQGENLVILGHNGAGKSTLINLIFGLLWLKLGTIKISAEKVGERKKIFLLPPENGLYQNMTIRENIYYRILLFKDKELDIKNIAEHKLIQKFLLSNYLNTKIIELSSGLQKRAAFVIGLLFQPEFLLLDEATNSIDPMTRELLIQELLVLKAKEKTVMNVTHDLDLAYQTADRLLTINHGEIVRKKKMTEYANFEQFQTEYFHDAKEEVGI